MPVYVDRALIPFRGRRMCHMLADTLEELHDMAGRIGMQRRWFQGERTPHYDLDEPRRALAVAAGAIEIDRRQAALMVRRWRARRPTGSSGLSQA